MTLSSNFLYSTIFGTAAGYYALGMTGSCAFQASLLYSISAAVICAVALKILGNENAGLADITAQVGGVAFTAAVLSISWQPVALIATAVIISQLALIILVGVTLIAASQQNSMANN